MTKRSEQMSETAMVRRSEMDNATLTAVVTDGDCSRLNEQQRREYYLARCDAAGLDPRTAPFMFTKLNGKLVLYALKSATDQLASNNRVATTILGRETVEGVYCVTVRATAADGRSTEDVGAVQIGSLKGEALANALMKAVTKAKRRAVLSLCGLGMPDETEVQDVLAARAAPEPAHDADGVVIEQPAATPAAAAPDPLAEFRRAIASAQSVEVLSAILAGIRNSTLTIAQRRDLYPEYEAREKVLRATPAQDQAAA